MITYTDSTIMPFGKHKDKKMANVPAAYLMWLHENGCSHTGVKQYINDNLQGLQQEAAKANKNKR